MSSALVFAAPASSAQPVGASSTPSAKSVREALLQADRALSASALTKGFVAAFGDALAPDALFLYEGAPIISGRANVLSLLGSQPTLTAIRVQWLPVVVAVSGDGSLGATYGITAISAAPRPDSALRFGKYISAWRRTPSGSWQLAAHVDMGLGDEKVVLPSNLTNPGLQTGWAGAAGQFAQADVEFARLADSKGAPAAFAAFAAPDAATLPGTGEIIIGPAAINARMLESPAARAKWEWHPLYSQASPAGDLGFTVGEATIRIPAPSGVTEVHSKYLTVWRRQPDGTIRFIVDGGNGR
jgi:ketosteroid isomerase-like protein